MKKKNIDFEFQSKIRQYMTSIFEKDFSSDDSVIEKLSHSLKEELLIKANGPLIKSVPSFKGLTESSLRKLNFALKKVVFHPEEFIYKVFYEKK